METVPVPGASFSVSRVALGTMTFADQADESQAGAMLEAAAAAGVTLLDTASSYVNGSGERMLGRLLRCFPGQFSIVSKVGGRPCPDAPDAPPLSAKAIRAGVEGSLRRLGRDTLDIFLLHHPDPSTPAEETVEEIGRLLAEGKIVAYGASNFAAWRYAELVWTARQADLPEPVVAELPYNLISRRLEEEYAEYAARQGIVTLVFNPLAGGLLTGKYTQDRHIGAGGRFRCAERGAMYQERYWREGSFAAVESLTRIAADAGISLVKLALRWLLSRPLAGSVLLGASNAAQLSSNLAAVAGPPLGEDVLTRCDEVWCVLRGAAPAYGQ